MRYSIFEYSQEKLVSLGLDVTDALLLNWFVNFFCGKMEKRIFKDANNVSKLYGWVKSSKIIEDLPVIGISSEKGIRRRFDSFVEKGILEREILITQQGKKSYYKTTSIYDSLINTTALEHNNKNENIENTKKNMSNNSQGNSDGLAENRTTENTSNNSQRTKMTHAKNNNPKIDDEISQGNSDGLAQGNSDGLAQGNSDGLALNNSLINDYLNKDTAAIKKLVEKYFGLDAFDLNFPTKAAAFLNNKKIIDYNLYFNFIKSKVHEKNSIIKNPRGFAYTIFFQEDVVQEFLEFEKNKTKNETEQKKLNELNNIICPVCGNKHNKYEDCPLCSFNYLELQNISDRELQKRIAIFKLTPEDKNFYEKELQNIYSQYENIFQIITNPLIKKEIEIKTNELDKKFGININEKILISE